MHNENFDKRKLRAVAEKFNQGFIALFGSRAKGEKAVKSDLNLAVLLEEPQRINDPDFHLDL